MQEYFYKAGRCVANLDANTVGHELNRIYNKHGALAPATVVKESKPKQAPLHGAFEWNDQIAAEEHRLHQARQIINVVTVVPEDRPNTLPVQAFINVTVVNDDDKNERRYTPVKEVIDTPGLYDQHLSHLKYRLKNMKIELSKFVELAQVCDAIDSVT
jgi:hypothetical protein